MISMELMLIWGLMFLNTLMIASGFYIYNGFKKLGLRFDALLVNPFFQKPHPEALPQTPPPMPQYYPPKPIIQKPEPIQVPELMLDEKDQEINALKYELEEMKDLMKQQMKKRK